MNTLRLPANLTRTIILYAAVALFLADKIGFYDIYRLVSQAVEEVPFIQNPTLEEILEADRLARISVRKHYC